MHAFACTTSGIGSCVEGFLLQPILSGPTCGKTRHPRKVRILQACRLVYLQRRLLSGRRLKSPRIKIARLVRRASCALCSLSLAVQSAYCSIRVGLLPHTLRMRAPNRRSAAKSLSATDSRNPLAARTRVPARAHLRPGGSLRVWSAVNHPML